MSCFIEHMAATLNICHFLFQTVVNSQYNPPSQGGWLYCGSKAPGKPSYENKFTYKSFPKFVMATFIYLTSNLHFLIEIFVIYKIQKLILIILKNNLTWWAEVAPQRNKYTFATKDYLGLNRIPKKWIFNPDWLTPGVTKTMILYEILVLFFILLLSS